MITLIGAKGSMGTRYRAILDYLGQEYAGFDREDYPQEIIASLKNSFGAIVASPTATHDWYVRTLISNGCKKILCEKPLTKDPDGVKDLLFLARSVGCELSLMLQYEELVDGKSSGDSSYDYFRTGPDGLYWDCFQIIGLAKGNVTVNNESPVWKCTINGQKLSLADMDLAYLSAVSKWLTGGLRQDPDRIIHMHEKVKGYFDT